MGQNQRPRKGRLDLLVQDVIMCSENPIKASTPTAAQDEVSTPKPASRRIWGRTNSIRVNGAEVFCFFPGGSLPNPCPKRRFESWYAVDSHKLNPREIGQLPPLLHLLLLLSLPHWVTRLIDERVHSVPPRRGIAAASGLLKGCTRCSTLQWLAFWCYLQP